MAQHRDAASAGNPISSEASRSAAAADGRVVGLDAPAGKADLSRDDRADRALRCVSSTCSPPGD